MFFFITLYHVICATNDNCFGPVGLGSSLVQPFFDSLSSTMYSSLQGYPWLLCWRDVIIGLKVEINLRCLRKRLQDFVIQPTTSVRDHEYFAILVHDNDSTHANPRNVYNDIANWVWNKRRDQWDSRKNSKNSNNFKNCEEFAWLYWNLLSAASVM